jgi:hypothetical protein
MAFMGAMRMIKAEYAAFVDSGQMRQEKSEIVLNDLTFPVNPDLLTKNAYSAGTPKSRLVIGFLAKITSSAHIHTMPQVMLLMQHLHCSRCKPDDCR